MKIDERLGMDEYYKKYPQKRPKLYGSPEEKCGDNLYFQKDGVWNRAPSDCHNSRQAFEKDVGKWKNGLAREGRPVFVSHPGNFYYFGSNRIEIPVQFKQLIQDRQGVKYNESIIESIAVPFINWVKKNYSSGLIGKPNDSRDPEETNDKHHLIAIDPVEKWLPPKEGEFVANRGCGPKPPKKPKGCCQ
jgi:hypothetical protein